MRLREFSNNDFVTVNADLNPKLWQEGRLDGEVRSKLIDIARAFVDFVGIDLDVKIGRASCRERVFIGV
jgi:hypothetical protein